MCACVHTHVLSCVQLLATSWTATCQAPQSTGFSRQKYWRGLPFPSPGDLPDPGIELESPALEGGFFTAEPPGKRWPSVNQQEGLHQEPNHDLRFSQPPKLWKVSLLFKHSVQFSSVTQCVWLFATPCTAAYQPCLSITNSQSWLKLMSIELVMPSNHLILGHHLLLPPSDFLSIMVFSQWVSSSHQVAKVLEFQLQHQSFPWIFRTDFL